MTNEISYPQQSTALSYLYGQETPLQILNQLNPEIAAITYASINGLFSKDLIPLLVDFRQCQAHEKIARLGAFVDTLAIKADESKAKILAKTKERVGELEREAIIAQASIASDAHVRGQKIEYDAKRDIASVQGAAIVKKEELRSKTSLDIQILKNQNERYAIDQKSADELAKLKLAEYVASQQAAASITKEAIHCNTALEIRKMEYELNRCVLENDKQTKKYLSDNEIKALELETQALKDVVLTHVTYQKEMHANELDAKVRTEINKAEKEYLAKIKKAELSRLGNEHHDRALVIEAYLKSQAVINRAMFELECIKEQTKFATEQAKAKIEQAKFRALADISDTLASVLKSDAKKVKYSGKIGPDGIKINMEVDDGK